MTVTDPRRMNEVFAEAFNSRSIDKVLALYEPDAILKVDGGGKRFTGFTAIADELRHLMEVPGTMVSRNNFCIEHGDLALLRADWQFLSDDGAVLATGSSAELVRRQPDDTWRYVIDHAVGAGLPWVG